MTTLLTIDGKLYDESDVAALVKETAALRAEVARAGVDLKARDARIVELNGMLDESRAEVAELKSKLAEEESTHEKCLAILMQREDDRQWEAHHNGFAQCETIAWRVIGERDAALASLASLREAAGSLVEALVESLPKCDECGKPATRAFCRGEGRWRDEHAPTRGGRRAPEYPRAVPLRDLIALLSGAEARPLPLSKGGAK